MENEILCSKCEAVIGEGDLYTHSPSKNGNWCAECTIKRAKENFAELKSLRSQLALVTADRDRMKAVLEHYADETNWQCDTGCSSVAHNSDNCCMQRYKWPDDAYIKAQNALRTADGEVTDEG